MIEGEKLIKPLAGSGAVGGKSTTTTSKVGGSSSSENKSRKETKRLKSKAASLINLGDVYAENGFNVLLIGLHGTGKTMSVMEIANRLGLKFKYFSCSTLDPYTDLVGIPVPMNYCVTCDAYYPLTDKKCVTCKGELVEALKSIRPREVDDAEMIFFDEFNRADSKTTNAVFEIIQFKSINGEPLPNLKCCWAAINPPDNEYQVEEVDPALMDRFDVYIEIKPKPNITYLVEQGIPIKVAQVLKSWWDEQNRNRRNFESYISPRRLEKIGHLFMVTGNTQAVLDALPKSSKANIDKNKLIFDLEVAVGKREATSGKLGQAAANFVYTPGALGVNKDEVIAYLEANPEDMETHKKIADTLFTTNNGADTLVKLFGGILNALKPSILEGYFNNQSSAKQSQMRRSFVDSKSSDSKKYDKLKNLEDILSQNSRIMNG